MKLSHVEIQRCDEATLRKEVLYPLLQALGYSEVFEWHGGAGELGKDLVAWKSNDLGHRENLAVVAKATAIKTNPQIQDVITQIRQSFNRKYDDPVSGEQQRIHWCWVVANKKIPKETRDRLRATIENESWNSHTEILDVDQLWTLVSKHLVTEIGGAISRVEKLITETSPYVVDTLINHPGKPFMSLTSGDRAFVFKESFEGQLQSEPVVMTGRFAFPNTPHGQEKLAELEAALTTGTPATIPAEYIDSLEVPEFITRLTRELIGDEPTSVGELRINSLPPDRHFPVRIEASGADGTQEVLEYVDLQVIRTGTDEVSLENTTQKVPFLVNLRLNRNDHLYSLSVGRRDSSLTVSQFRRLLKFMIQMGKAGHINIEQADNGNVLASLHRDTPVEGHSFDDVLEMVHVLQAVQDRTNARITIPNHDITEDEWQGIKLTQHPTASKHHPWHMDAPIMDCAKVKRRATVRCS